MSDEKAPAWTAPTDEEIKAILVDRVDNRKQSVGIVVGVVNALGCRVIAHGQTDQRDKRPVGGDTVFEIASITKIFTSLLLADMANRGEIALEDPVDRYLPPGTNIPGRNGKPITLLDLATHTSGLPRMPGNATHGDSENPHADYSEDRLYAFLGNYTLTRDPGTLFEYSNLGAGLLGCVLGARAGIGYEALLRERIAEPLDMKDTAVALSSTMRARLAMGHNSKMEPAKNWDLCALTGAGGIRSTVNDLLSFLSAQLGHRNSNLGAAMATQLSIRRPTGIGKLDIALGWHVLSHAKGTVIWHNGSTGGYSTFMGFNPVTGSGVIVLANAHTKMGMDDIGFHLLIGTRLAPMELTNPSLNNSKAD